ncbi:hypothetical protein ACFFUP_14880 [Vibrio ostreicida]|uniref:Lipoprotein n=1 Tax=Vibrio ostreicida TaxID=526588 RepID=A0ABT8BU91_9VIBR|nr:hypothetical protein [Vibrio ostreicida]MDN3609959.1 hypothetical protein [Vibrio ostreicida]NPD10386.1 hypothetical protein [Vibrio ostreicida]
MKKMILSALVLLPFGGAAAAGATIDTQFGEVYTDSNGMSLYTFAKDPVGQSVCTDDCAAKWPPLLAGGEADALFFGQAEFSKVSRDDGSEQWAKEGKPLYRWFKDTKPGEINGAGIKGVWPLARKDDVTIKLYNDGQKRYLVDSQNLALYTFDKDKVNQSVCYSDCELKWPPALVSPELAKDGVQNLTLTGGFGITQRKDQSYQWTYQNKPLYRWFKDSKPGDTSGDGVKNVWHLITQ